MNRGPRGSWIGNPEVPGRARGEGILRGRWYPDVGHMPPCAFSCRMQDERARDTVVLVYACLKNLSNFAFPPRVSGRFRRLTVVDAAQFGNAYRPTRFTRTSGSWDVRKSGCLVVLALLSPPAVCGGARWCRPAAWILTPSGKDSVEFFVNSK